MQKLFDVAAKQPARTIIREGKAKTILSNNSYNVYPIPINDLVVIVKVNNAVFRQSRFELYHI